MIFGINYDGTFIFNKITPTSVSRDDDTQKTTKDGIPLYHVSVLTAGKYGMDYIWVDVPSETDITDEFTVGQPVKFSDLTGNYYYNKFGQHILFTASQVSVVDE